MKEGFILGVTAPVMTEFGKSKESFQRMHDAGITLVRINDFPYPFIDSGFEKLSEKYLEQVEFVQKFLDEGLNVMIMPMIPGGSRANANGQVSYVRNYPEWMGPVDEDYYYECMTIGWEYVAKQFAGKVEYWQIANEHDHINFRGILTHEQNVRWMQTVARAVKKWIPDAKCGTNLSGESDERPYASLHSYARKMLKDTYAPEGLFDYVGLDAYYGSWSAGGPEMWTKYIDDAYEVTGKPVMIQEWGYSTLQRGTPRTQEDKNRHFNNSVCREKDWAAEPNGHMWQGKEHSEELQAEYIMACEKIFIEHPHCIGNLFFQWQDQERCWQCGEPDCPSECGWGCFKTDGTPKAGYYALVKSYQTYFKSGTD